MACCPSMEKVRRIVDHDSHCVIGSSGTAVSTEANRLMHAMYRTALTGSRTSATAEVYAQRCCR